MARIDELWDRVEIASRKVDALKRTIYLLSDDSYREWEQQWEEARKELRLAVSDFQTHLIRSNTRDVKPNL